MGKRKLKLMTIAVAVILLTLLAQGTMAYFQMIGRSTNVVTSGAVRLLIHEFTKEGNPFPEDGVRIDPGDVVSKEVFVESDCAHPFYLRMKVEFGVDDEMLSAENCFLLDIDTAHWELHDGWYYYTEVVEPGESTAKLFTEVEISATEVDNRYLGKTLTLTVVAQAVQSENNPLTDGAVHTAAGWPAE